MGKFNPVDAEVINELRQIAGEKKCLDRSGKNGRLFA